MTRPAVAALAVACWIAVAAGQAPRGQHTLVLVGIDGFRPDYLDRVDLPVLRRLAAQGVRAEGLIPPFPTKTFPSFTTIATGLVPARHGIVNNTIDDPALPMRFSLSDHVARSDPRWWLGEPIWVTAERQGVRTAGMFWPGDDVEIQGRRPSIWLPYDDDFPNDSRVDRVLEWLSRPAPDRPRLVMLYFSLVDVASHDFGPLAPETYAAARDADRLLGRLVDGVAARGHSPAANFVVVSDHGLAETSPSRTIVLDDYLDLAQVDVIETGPSVRLRPRDRKELAPTDLEAWTSRTLAALTGRHPHLTMYRGDALPKRFRSPPSARMPPVIGLADDGWVIVSRTRRESWIAEGGRPRGEHGFDPSAPSMRGLFVASGPAFRSGRRIAAFESYHAYEAFCRVLGIRPSKNDGDPAVLGGVFAARSRSGL